MINHYVLMTKIDINFYSQDPDGYNQRPVSGLLMLNDKAYHIGFGLKPFEAGFKVSRVISEPNPDPVINKWGDWFGRFRDLCIRECSQPPRPQESRL